MVWADLACKPKIIIPGTLELREQGGHKWANFLGSEGPKGTHMNTYIKPIYFKIDDMDLERRFVNLLGKFDPFVGNAQFRLSLDPQPHSKPLFRSMGHLSP